MVAQIHTVVMPPMSLDRLTQRGNVRLYCCILKVHALRTDCHCWKLISNISSALLLKGKMEIVSFYIWKSTLCSVQFWVLVFEFSKGSPYVALVGLELMLPCLSLPGCSSATMDPTLKSQLTLLRVCKAKLLSTSCSSGFAFGNTTMLV